MVSAMTLLEETKEMYERNVRGYRELVGTLYPSIVYNEILQLRKAYIENGGDVYDLSYLPGPPYLSGHTYK